MREIIFRGKRADNGEWVYGSLITERNMFDGNLMTMHIQDIEEPYDDNLIDDKTVGQYTGLTDKNGKKIFEGDIIQSIESGETGEIQYFPEHVAFMIFVKGSNCYLDYLGEVKPSIVKVIGNIHDNLELLQN